MYVCYVFLCIYAVLTWLGEGHHGEGHARSERQRRERLRTHLRDARQGKHVLVRKKEHIKHKHKPFDKINDVDFESKKKKMLLRLWTWGRLAVPPVRRRPSPPNITFANASVTNTYIHTYIHTQLFKCKNEMKSKCKKSIMTYETNTVLL